MFTVMRRRTALDLEDAVLMLRDQLAAAFPQAADESPAMGCCGCGSWMADVRTQPTDGAPHGELYCWRCVDSRPTIAALVATVLPGRGRR